MIIYKNLRNTKQFHDREIDFRIDRGSPVGNPFHMKDESERNLVCDLYDEWFNYMMDFREELEDSEPEFYRYVDIMVDAYRVCGRVDLWCWCIPKRCHGITIANYIRKVAHKGEYGYNAATPFGKQIYDIMKKSIDK